MRLGPQRMLPQQSLSGGVGEHQQAGYGLAGTSTLQE